MSFYPPDVLRGLADGDVFGFTLILSGEANRQISELKFKLVKAEQEVTALEQNVSLCSFLSIRRRSVCRKKRQH